MPIIFCYDKLFAFCLKPIYIEKIGIKFLTFQPGYLLHYNDLQLFFSSYIFFSRKLLTFRAQYQTEFSCPGNIPRSLLFISRLLTAQLNHKLVNQP